MTTLYEAVVLKHFDVDRDGKIGPDERVRVESVEKLVFADEVDVTAISPGERAMLAEIWLAHVLTENVSRQDEGLSASDYDHAR